MNSFPLWKCYLIDIPVRLPSPSFVTDPDSGDVLPYRLHLLEFIPEITPPSRYRKLLPPADEAGNEREWQGASQSATEGRREGDWVYQPWVLRQIGVAPEQRNNIEILLISFARLNYEMVRSFSFLLLPSLSFSVVVDKADVWRGVGASS